MSAIIENLEQTIKRKLVAHAIDAGLNEELTKDIAHHDINTLNRLLEYTRMEAWQDGHDTALINGQSQNPHQHD